MEKWEWNDPLYEVRVILLRSTPAEAAAYLQEEFDVEDDFSGSGKTIYIQHGQHDMVLWFRPEIHRAHPAYAGLIAHECLHGTVFTLKHSGLSLSDSSEEAYAYHIQWLTREVTKRLKKKEKKCRRCKTSSVKRKGGALPSASSPAASS